MLHTFTPTILNLTENVNRFLIDLMKSGTSTLYFRFDTHHFLLASREVTSKMVGVWQQLTGPTFTSL